MKNLFTKRLLISTAAVSMLFGSAITANAAQEDLFDAQYYAETYPDVAAAVGNDENALLQHYLAYGITEGRNANAYFNTLAYRTHTLIWTRRSAMIGTHTQTITLPTV